MQKNPPLPSKKTSTARSGDSSSEPTTFAGTALLPEDAVVVGSAWHGSVRGTDGQVHVRLSRLSIHRLGL